MLLRGIAFAEARRNSARRVLNRQNSDCPKENDGILPRNARKTFSFEGEATSLVAVASKLAGVEDGGPGPEAKTALRVSPSAKATLKALRAKHNTPINPRGTRDAETITEVCSGGELPEVEIISLLEEQIPRYKLRADTLTQFQGYENCDWFVPSPALKSLDIDLKLSPDQIRETLNYFSFVEILAEDAAALPEGQENYPENENDHEEDPYEYDEEIRPKNEPPCPSCGILGKGAPIFVLASPSEPCNCVSFLCSNRVSQMTKTYNDIEAVTRLLEEKEKDLELTARIGKELLSHNQKLESNVSSLESDLKEANERITQLSHELSKKTELIQILSNDAEDNSETVTPTGFRGINLDLMQRKISSLEDENKQLRNEFTKLIRDTDLSEEQEAKLVKDIAAQLASANMEVDGIADELERQKEENRLQHEQIVSLSSKLAETELRLAQLLAEHDEVGNTLIITRDNQNTLAGELAEFKDRYAEMVNLLAETQEQLRKQRKRCLPTVRGGSLFPSAAAAPLPDSIASELESSLYSELSLDSGISADRIPPYKKVFETVRSASRTSYGPDSSQFPRIGSMTTSTLSTGSMGPRMSCGQLRPTASAFPSLDSTGHSDSEGSIVESEDYPGPQQPGVPGAPGASDLEAALRRLTPAEVIARRACLSTGAYSYDYDAPCRTPDSIMSTGSSGNLSGFSGNAWRIPEKLQIVKPLEGSQTLMQWSQLATPTLGGLLEDRPGVKTRGGRGLEDLGLLTFTLSDLEEDEEYQNPGKLFQDTGSVYTYTNSTVLHPDDHTSVTTSIVGSRVATAPTSEINSGVSTPRTLSRRNSTSTFSTTLGLAKMLNERGIKAVTPSCAGTPSSDRNFTPTATPCNSPLASPPETRPGSPTEEPGLSMGLLSTGAEILKRTFGGESEPKRKRAALSRSEKKALTSIRLVEKLERIGINTIMATTVSSISPLALPGSLYTRRSTESPMAQLTFLKASMTSSGSQDKIEGKPEKKKVKGTRPDLGRVIPAVDKEGPPQSTLGTISSLLFGRKGGLL